MSDRRDETGRRRREPAAPIVTEDLAAIESGPVVGLPTAAGPLHDDVRRGEITGRFTALADHPALQRAFLRLAEQREEDRRGLEHRIAELADQLRARDHAVRNDLSAAIVKVADAQHEHDVLDEQRHADLAGRPGGGTGRVGVLELRLEHLDDAQAGLGTVQAAHTARLDRDHQRIGSLEASRGTLAKVVIGIAGAVAGSVVTAVLAIRAASYSSGLASAERTQLVEAVRSNTATLSVIKAVLYSRGLLSVPDGALPLPSLTDPGDSP